MSRINLPNSNDAEISLIGTGGGYGESNVIHLGNNEWIVIDCCINPITKECLPLKYLRDIGVELSKHVKLIICTHWHDDHILGMSQLLDACEGAEFFFAGCTDRDKFLSLIEIDAGKAIDNKASSSTTEFYKCLNIIADRGNIPKRAVVDRLLYKSLINLNCEVYSLSPSDYTLQEFDKEISTLIKIVSHRNRKLIDKSPNAKSVVIYLRINSYRVLLGADLEVSKNRLEGWHNILDNSKVIDSKSTIFKIPHHASENGYLKDVWDSLLESNPIANITPWRRGRVLPQKDMLEKISEHTNQIFITSNILTIGNKAKTREKGLEKLIREKNPSLREVKFKDGLIRCRVNIDKVGNNWNIEMFGEAVDVKKTILTP